jgi:hypothetical protein
MNQSAAIGFGKSAPKGRSFDARRRHAERFPIPFGEADRLI